MAVTKIWQVKDSMSRVLNYAANPEKTGNLERVLHYAVDDSKTSSEQRVFVTGVNCSADTAIEEMTAVQRRFDKQSGNLAYHAYQSFKRGEVSPEEAHQIGVELAHRMWGSGHQVLVATHLNTGTYHNHLVVNAVDMWNGKKFNCNEGAYWRLRALSDELCREHGLVVIESPKGKTPRPIYEAEKRGEPTKYNLMREAIDTALSVSYDAGRFQSVMGKLGYYIDLDPGRKYATIRFKAGGKPTRLYRLGEGYGREDILRQLDYNLDYDFGATVRRYGGFLEERKIRAKSEKPPRPKATGLRALYYRYCYLLGIFPYPKRTPLSPEMREEVRRMKRYSSETDLIVREGLESVEDVQVFIRKTEEELSALVQHRKKLYKKVERSESPEEKEKAQRDREACSAEIKRLRKAKATAENILEDLPRKERNLEAEETMLEELQPKTKTRDYER